MRITILLDNALLQRARQVTGIQDVDGLVRAGLQALIAREAGRRLATLAGTMPGLTPPPRRRSRRRRR